MYQPKHFNENNITHINNVIKEFDFATLVISINDQLEISHLPIILDEENTCLYGHIAIANPITKILEDSSTNINVTVIFQGPHSYISNSYYTNPEDNVPTWNYVAVHVSGKITLIKDKNEMVHIINTQFAKYETTTINWDHPRVSKLVNGIYGIKIDIETIEAKFKLSQNKNYEEQLSIINNLKKDNLLLADFMQKYLNINS